MPAATLTVFGEGPARDWLSGLAAELGIEDAVCFAGHLPRAQLMGQISSYTALVFPSLHDSGGLVVLEAMTAAVPVICLDLGGPGMMVDASCGVVVPTASSDEANVVTAIAQAMTTMDGMQENDWSRLSAGAVLRARELSWSRLTARVTA
jgi:glycosyltransferase involved in cell wall biosynthesis